MALVAMLALLGGKTEAYSQAPAFTKLKNVLVLDKSRSGPHGHFESRRDFNAALGELAAEKGFQVTIISQDDPAARIDAEFSAEGLAAYQAVIFCYNDGVQEFLNDAQKTRFENYVRNGGGFVPIHSASDFIWNWPWMTSVLVESYYGPHGTNQPTADLAHDPEGMLDGTETRGIFKGLTAPPAFLDEFYSYRASPRGRPGVTILLTVDEESFSKPINGPMGEDHPVAWAKAEGEGRVAHISLGHSWQTNNVYAAKDGYLKKFLYGALRYVAGDFKGCTDHAFKEYNPDATRSDPEACVIPKTPAIVAAAGGVPRTLISREEGNASIRVRIEDAGTHHVILLDVAGSVVDRRNGAGRSEYLLPAPSRGGLYTVVVKSGREVTVLRMTVL